MMNNEHISTNFETFTFRRRKQVYENLNDEEQRRFTDFIEACSKKPMKKKLLDVSQPKLILLCLLINSAPPFLL